MPGTRFEQALAAAQDLSRLNEEERFIRLGQQIEDVKNLGGFRRAQNFAGSGADSAKDMPPSDELKEIGRRWWAKLEPELMKLVCDPNSEEAKRIMGGRTPPEIAASLATKGICSAFAPPSWIIVATSILAAKITETGLSALCEVWRELSESTSSSR